MYYYNPDGTSPMIEVYKKCIHDHQTEIEELLKVEARISEDVIMDASSMLLVAMAGKKGDQVLNRFCQVVNEEVPIKVDKSRPNAKYCTIKPDFRDPRDWQEFTGEAPEDNPAITTAIKRNNQKMLDQFFRSRDGKMISNQGAARAVLEAYLNDYLVYEQLRLVTTNLALVNVYYWSILSVGQDDFPIEVFERFFTFLSRTGIVSQATVRHVVANMENALENYSGNVEPVPDDQIIELSDDDIDKLFTDIQEPDNREEVVDKDFVDKINSRYIHPERLDLTYEVTVTLSDFNPQMSRKFYIAGDQPIANLQAVIIEMFHGSFEHLYDLVNEEASDYFILPNFIDGDFLPGGGKYNVINAEQATVSMLNEGDQLVLHYDYGDGWEFKVTIGKMVANYVGYEPIVVDAHGYGIIDGIGGAGALEDYYHDYQCGQVEPAIKEWLGGKLIDLDKVDINELNHRLRILEE